MDGGHGALPHAAGKRRKQWRRLVRALEMAGQGRVLVLGDHSSILDKELDMATNAAEVPEIIRARTEEKEAHSQLGIVDAWPICHPNPETEEEKGLTRGGRRIDRISILESLTRHVEGMFLVGIGGSDQRAVHLDLRPEEGRGAGGRAIIARDVVEDPEFERELQ